MLTQCFVVKQLADEKSCIFVAGLGFSQNSGQSRFLFLMLDLWSLNEKWWFTANMCLGWFIKLSFAHEEVKVKHHKREDASHRDEEQGCEVGYHQEARAELLGCKIWLKVWPFPEQGKPGWGQLSSLDKLFSPLWGGFILSFISLEAS